MQQLALAMWAATVAMAASTDMPVYCRLLQVGLESVTHKPILEDVNVSIVQHAPLLGDVDVSVSHLEIDSLKVVTCGASVNDQGIFNVGFQRVEISLAKLAWRYRQRNWPHGSDFGEAFGNTAVSFNMSVDMGRKQDHLFLLHVDEIAVTLGAQQHPWLTGALTKLLTSVRPIVSMVVQHEAQKVLDESLDVIRSQGACFFIENVLKEANFTAFSFKSYQPTTVHVPLVGDLDVSVNSTSIQPPTTMQCEHVGFDGHLLEAHIANVPFSAGFNWAYRKNGSSFWHNQGTGSTNVVAGTILNIDLLNPSATYLKVDLPSLKLQIDAESNKWLYNALTTTMVPLIREALQLFGGKFLAYEIKKCLEDPTCPHLPVSAVRSSSQKTEARTAVGNIIV